MLVYRLLAPADGPEVRAPPPARRFTPSAHASSQAQRRDLHRQAASVLLLPGPARPPRSLSTGQPRMIARRSSAGASGRASRIGALAIDSAARQWQRVLAISATGARRGRPSPGLARPDERPSPRRRRPARIRQPSSRSSTRHRRWRRMPRLRTPQASCTWPARPAAGTAGRGGSPPCARLWRCTPTCRLVATIPSP